VEQKLSFARDSTEVSDRDLRKGGSRESTDAKAKELACAVNTLANTVGEDIVYATDLCAPQTIEGKPEGKDDWYECGIADVQEACSCPGSSARRIVAT
jgi:hypothetical protein